MDEKRRERVKAKEGISTHSRIDSSPHTYPPHPWIHHFDEQRLAEREGVDANGEERVIVSLELCIQFRPQPALAEVQGLEVP